MHEEDAGIIWKHTELRTMHPEVRRGRKLVISFIATVGQYRPFPPHVPSESCALPSALPDKPVLAQGTDHGLILIWLTSDEKTLV